MFKLMIFTILLFASNIVAAQTATKAKVTEGDVLYIVDGQLSSKRDVDALDIESIKNVNVLSEVKKVVVVTTQNGASGKNKGQSVKSGTGNSSVSVRNDSLRREYAIKLVQARSGNDVVLRVLPSKDTTAPKHLRGTINRPTYIVRDSKGRIIMETANYSEIQEIQTMTVDKIKAMSIIGNMVMIQLK